MSKSGRVRMVSSAFSPSTARVTSYPLNSKKSFNAIPTSASSSHDQHPVNDLRDLRHSYGAC